MYDVNFVSEYLTSDFKRLDLILNSLVKAVRFEKSMELQQSLFFLFKRGLMRHIHWEEGVLFPIFERESRISNGPTRIMKEEHSEMSNVLNSIEDTLDHHIDLEKLVALGNCLDEHNLKEKRILYPSIDRMLDKDTQEMIAVAISREFQ
ncbi:MAG: hemerythrin domain-containing protein [Bermanella sp.]